MKLKPNLSKLNEIFTTGLPGVWNKFSVVQTADCSAAKTQHLVQFLAGVFCRCLMCVTNKCDCSVLSRGTKKQEAL